jgi:AraC-like DNA-binding protein
MVMAQEGLQRLAVGLQPIRPEVLAHRGARFSQALCASLMPTLLYKIVEQSVPYQDIDSRSLATYQRLRELLDQDFLQLKNIEEAAARCKVTVPYVCRLFKRFDHVTPYQYLLRHKMQYAADLLSDPQVLVKQVAQRLEFADQYQFSRAFKRIFGLSPTQFQRRLVSFDQQGKRRIRD